MKHEYGISAAAMAAALLASSPAAAQGTGGEAVSTMQQELAAMRAQMDAMAQRIESLENELEAAQAAPAQGAAPTSAAAVAPVAAPAQPATGTIAEATDVKFGGAPEISRGDWSFKPRGRLQYDAGFVDAPDSTGADNGFGSEARRIRLGASGDMPGGFGYKLEVDFAGNDIAVTDALIAYDAGGAAITVGQMNPFQSLEELTSSLHTSFIERAAFTDAFGFERRVGAAASFSAGDVSIDAGIFTDNMEDLPSGNWGADGRVVFSPKLGETQLHLGGSVHYNDLEAGSTVRYRQRPLVHFTSDRFVNTGTLAAESEFGVGAEAAVIAGPFHAVAEGHWQHVNTVAGIAGADADPTFFGGYAELGYFFTRGDTRGYKGGKFDRTKPANPVGEGGAGSLQANLRYDYLDLSDNGVIGGTQNGYFVSLVWKPTNYTMLLANYGKLSYSDAALAAAGGDTDYDVDVFGLRAQIDF